jgi:hypothetical protein
MIELVFPCSRALRESFRQGTLALEWAARYPHLFDEQDVKLAQNQRDAHFYEWLAAILLFEATGYCSLVEKYDSRSHIKKIEVFARLVPSTVREYICEEINGGAPDLFVYDPMGSDWFFCEVKGPTDTVRPGQAACWHRLSELSGREVRLLRFEYI